MEHIFSCKPEEYNKISFGNLYNDINNQNKKQLINLVSHNGELLYIFKLVNIKGLYPPREYITSIIQTHNLNITLY